VQAYPTEANVASPQKTNWKLSTGNIMDIGNNVEIQGGCENADQSRGG
jgi:hypothetical protein